MSVARSLALFVFLGLIADAVSSQETKSVEEIAAQAQKSLVVILSATRDGKQQGIGTGFAISQDGLIATNLHVIGEARPISVQLADGKRHEVTAIHASDRSMDLALIRIDAKNLPALALADSGAANPGQPIVVVGHPRGLKNSVVSGVLSGKRDIDGMSMLQLAIPIEQGNSGGPVLDMQGKVLGIVTMKSLVTANLGFAVPSSALQPLLAKPNPIPMERWLTIGALDKADWALVFGGRWRQRAGRIIADAPGNSFGGRTLCLWQRPLPQGPHEIGVSVRLENESGAAGLVFHADGGDRHYGFYATSGKLRFTRFEGADVNSWNILEDSPSPHYRHGEWNHLKVRFDNGKMYCFVNDHQFAEIADAKLKEGTVGLCKFRDPSAEFKQFQIAAKIPPSGIPAEVKAEVAKALAKTAAADLPSPETVESLLPHARPAAQIIRDKARQLETQAAQLRKLAQAVHQEHAVRRLANALRGADNEIDLARAALFVAALDNEELDVEAYVKDVDRLAREALATFPKNADENAKIAALSRFLFEERGFHGSRAEYYTRANSYLNEVMDDREGLPITLSILYMEVARRLDMKVVGIGLPARFVVRHEPKAGMPQLIDVYSGGKLLSEDEADALVRQLTGQPLQREVLAPVPKPAIIVRMLMNLGGVAASEKDLDGCLCYLDAILGIDPTAHAARANRALYRAEVGLRQGALADCDWLLEHNPPGVNMSGVRKLRSSLLKSTK